MEAERWREIERLFHAAAELEEDAREAFLKHACADDKSLHEAVRMLLGHAQEGKTFLENPALEVAAKELAGAGAAPRGANGALPAAIGRYRIIRPLGEGGMGTVYEAEQDQPRRSVALKVIKPGLATGDRLWRFEHEAQALGRLQHSGIAQIYEAGTANTGFGPQPYFAMELVRGLPLREYARANALNTRQRLALMVKICEGVNHAHQRGLIHRDLKPGNILVDETGQPKILDFGVARATGSDEQATQKTDLGQIVGTLAYMSPEQVLGDPLEMDTRSDVYSLGVILYELLAGRLPYEVNRRPLHVAVQAIREDDAASLSSINRRFRGDIETIVGKALEKDKTRRYASAADLGADIRRYLEDQPIAARPPSSGYQLRKFTRRNKALVAGVAAVFVVLAGGVAVSTSQAIRADRAGRTALAERDRASASQRAATKERDRALSAETSATSERNRAVAAEAQVVQQRDGAVLEKKRADEQAATARAVNDFLQNDLLAQASARVQSGPKTKPDPDLKVRTALDRAAARIQGKFDGQPAVEASIRQTIASVYVDLGVYRDAQSQLERALDLRRRALGEDNPDTLATMSDLANVYRIQSAYSRAETLLAKVLLTQRRVLGEENRDTLNTMNGLATVYLDQHKERQAEPLLVTTLRVQRRVLGPDDPDTLTSMHDLATAYYGEGKHSQAEPLAMQALEARRRVLGEEHPQTVRSASLLGQIYQQEAKLAQAEAVLSDAVDVQRRVLGEEHPDTLTGMNNLAIVYRAEGKYAQAEALYIRVLENRRRVLGAEHANTVNSMNNLGVLYLYEGKFAQSESLLTAAVDIRTRLFGGEDAIALSFQSRLGELYRLEGKYAQAETTLVHVMENRRRILTEKNPDTLRIMQELGRLYRDQGRNAEAEEQMTQVYELRRGLLAPEHPDVLRSMSDLGALYYDEGKDELAEPLLVKALDLRRRVLGPENPDTLETMATLGEVELHRQRFPDAEVLLREALGTTEKVNPGDWSRYYLEGLVGASLAGQKKHADAEPLLVSGYEGMAQRVLTIPADKRSALEQTGVRIVELYEGWGKPGEAAEWRRKLQAK